MGTLIKLTLTPGTEVGYNGANYSIKRVLDLSNVLIEHLETKTLIRVEIKDLVQCYTDIEKPKVKKHTDAFHYSEKDWAIALKRLAIITPIIQNKLGTEEIKAIASKEKVHISTIYRWIERYQKTQQTSSLVRDNKTPVTKKGRLDDEVELIISTAIEDVYLTRQKKSVQKVCDEVIRRCNNAKIVPPSPATIRRRIDVMSDEHKMRHRLGYEVSRTKYDPIQGHLEAPHPLALVQIDHTRLDIILVDEIHRKPMTRPWITLAIDVFSRMVVGLYISFDPPGALATGMCIANAILPKEMWLAKNDIRGEWPCWGIMDTIHADNAKEFRGNMLKRAAEEYGINLEWRKLKQPNWGGHIERYLGTLLKEIHALPGTTFSNTQERKSYNSEKQAALTIKELEKWITTFIVNVYHNKYHSGIGTSPLAKFNEGIFGTPETKGRGIPTRIYNERKIRLDFMPYEERSVQEYGVQIDHIHYYDDKLRPYINALEPEFKKRRVRRKFIFKRDPGTSATFTFMTRN